MKNRSRVVELQRPETPDLVQAPGRSMASQISPHTFSQCRKNKHTSICTVAKETKPNGNDAIIKKTLLVVTDMPAVVLN